MNKKTLCVALLFLCATLVWLGVNIYWAFTGPYAIFDIVIALIFVLAGAGMVWNEFGKKKRKHLAEVNKHQIP